jgi:FAD/FMN-containing dehydrogenase
MFIGSEGTLGVITRVVLALHPRPANLVTALCAIGSFEDALVILRRADAALPGGLMAFEAMWADFLAVATDRCGVPNPLSGSPPLTLLVEIAPEQALETLPVLLPDAQARARALATVADVAGPEEELGDPAQAMLARLRALLPA